MRKRTVEQMPTVPMPQPHWGSWPAHRTTTERIAWLQEQYGDYPAYLNALLQGGVDFGGLTSAQPILEG